ncbi:ferric reductase-like transmembrane domain-containing protein [Cytophagaceae bacterium YF14B1]|uniref:Ferric reductase-like transmembrane domain-containing protein n=1 Tax=Xanthocytophaga flava TaxID=3048013 RepID=A0AAE3QPR8_9BACT|nr:ferric reductase-like transmembrane domain-containing protein [Xanthocytophaga flavus]MDJ1482646.1 ferric reductase-like transmembrane domain-containing protein [Xanthocytophaga flavus]
MNTSTKLIVGALLTGCLIYIVSPGPMHLLEDQSGWEVREQLVYVTGMCTISLMVLSMILSIRVEYITNLTGGLDKTYIVHKWTGIFSTLFAVLHWSTEKVPHWLVELSIISNPGELTDGSQFSELEITLFQSGVLLAEVFFYVFIVLIAIAIFTKIPYRFFRRSHKLFPVVFLLLSYHAATAPLKEHWLESPAFYILGIMLVVGCVAACIALFQQIGQSRKVQTIITAIDQHRMGILDIQLKTTDRPLSYTPGQYVFLQFAHDNEPHPFSIASFTNGDPILRFAIKEMGVFTRELPSHIYIGQRVIIEGPYGNFTFKDSCQRQIWIAAGIGITPFMAQLEYLSLHRGTDKPIDFWYCTRGELASQYPSSIMELCKKNGIRFYSLNSSKGEYLTADILKKVVSDFTNVSIWFCGPEKFAKCLKKDLKQYHFENAHFHYDSFSMR